MMNRLGSRPGTRAGPPPVPAGAMAAAPISTIVQGNTVFLGEEGLDVTPALNGHLWSILRVFHGPTEANSAPRLTQIGWWASAANIYTTAPSRTIDLISRYTAMTIAPSDFVGYTGNWYLLGVERAARIKSPPVPGCGCTATMAAFSSGLYGSGPEPRHPGVWMQPLALMQQQTAGSRRIRGRVQDHDQPLPDCPAPRVSASRSGSMSSHRTGPRIVPDQQGRGSTSLDGCSDLSIPLFNGPDLGYRQV